MLFGVVYAGEGIPIVFTVIPDSSLTIKQPTYNLSASISTEFLSTLQKTGDLSDRFFISFGLGVDDLLVDIIDLRLQVHYSKRSPFTSGDVAISLSALHKLINTKDWVVYVGGGMGMQFSNQSKPHEIFLTPTIIGLSYRLWNDFHIFSEGEVDYYINAFDKESVYTQFYPSLSMGIKVFID